MVHGTAGSAKGRCVRGEPDTPHWGITGEVGWESAPGIPGSQADAIRLQGVPVILSRSQQHVLDDYIKWQWRFCFNALSTLTVSHFKQVLSKIIIFFSHSFPSVTEYLAISGLTLLVSGRKNMTDLPLLDLSESSTKSSLWARYIKISISPICFTGKMKINQANK